MDPEVFARFPGYVRGVVLAYDVANKQADDASDGASARRRGRRETRRSIRPAWPSTRGCVPGARPTGPLAPSRASTAPRSRRWSAGYCRGDALPSINALVDLGNVVSLRHLVPAGAHAIDVVTGDIALRPATGIEDFVALGSEAVEHPERGEIIFPEGDIVVLTRRWTWRQGQHTLAGPSTRAVEFNVDGLPPVSPPEVEAICQELAGLIERFCGGTTRLDLLTPHEPRIAF